MKVALIGASGCVGGFVVKHLLESGATVVLINRRHLKQYEGNPSVEQHVVDLGSITPNNLKSSTIGLVKGADAAVCTLGVGAPSKVTAGMLRRVDIELPTAFAEAAKDADIKHMALLSSVGADSKLPSTPHFLTGTGAGGRLYLHAKGKVEDNFTALGFKTLSIFRPSTITGNPNTPKVMNFVHKYVNGIIPARFHNIDAEDLGKSMAYQIRKAVEQDTKTTSARDKPIMFEGASLFELLAQAAGKK